ncbi:ubiquitin-like protein HUB1 [Aspergillus ruber CBS 135680]|uniref:Ubiquitin-like modifier HUB1 n=1 Tax=Aspergillus ruber (strain CBS 135680) TaxID=1388766 RepID=A0A017S230_ASPRC|nr:ubiquitin-like protein [Aspergillus ruber CBS 135680]EYE90225.1 ubiquitin-like protein [Aspergillus ruber CBS 135680]
MDDRRRSRSPDREKSRKSTGGFRWKEKRRDDGDSRGAGDDRRLERGYRGGDRPRSPRRDRDRDSDRYGDRYRDGDRRDGDRGRERTERDEKEEKRERKREKREKKAAVAAQSAEPMIVVNVNDRLGTKAAIPCLASDPIKLFKAQVAARIGREPHEILLKRQGERPFKDHLTLEDYGISNGVQLDLEVGTGD